MAETSTYETHNLKVCDACIMFLANGDVGDYGPIPWDARLRAKLGIIRGEGIHLFTWDGDDHDENPTTRHAALIEEQWPSADGWELVAGTCEDDDYEFSWASCDACGTRLGGTRHTAHAMRRRGEVA